MISVNNSNFISSDANKKPIRKREKWSNIINESKDIDISRPLNYITARQIKKISNEEPRLMAKMDRLEEVPKIFRDNNLFLLPISRKEYVIAKGKGYHQLETITKPPNVHYAQIPFPKSFADFESEQVYINYAYSTGLIERFAQISLPNPPLQIRVNTPEFDLNVNYCSIHVNRAQIEIDAITQSLETTIIIEAKIGLPSSFSIRQMYYPFRAFLNKRKKVRSFFFCIEPKENLYMFWEYTFNPYTSLESISLIDCRQFKIRVSNVPSIKQFTNISTREDLVIPQADDVNKIIQFPLRVYEGYNTSEKMENVFDFTNRQSSYYRHASEILGLVESDDQHRYKLTDKGEQYFKLPAEKRSNFICRLLLEFPIMNEIFLDLSSDRDKSITKQNIIELLKKKSDLTGSTLERRARTIRSWFRWIRNNLGIVEVDRNGRIRISRQMRL
jgi:C-terminal AAA-associated domain